MIEFNKILELKWLTEEEAKHYYECPGCKECFSLSDEDQLDNGQLAGEAEKSRRYHEMCKDSKNG